MSQDLYKPPQAELAEPVTARHELAERGTRLVAWIVDGLLIAPGFVPMIPALAENSEPGIAAIAFLGIWTIALLVINLVFISQTGQMIAKRWFKIRVVRADGSPISVGRYVGLRVIPIQLGSAIPILGNLVALANALAIFRESRKCLHDEIADTIVVKC